jgi:hypothetical protein
VWEGSTPPAAEAAAAAALSVGRSHEEKRDEGRPARG